MAAISQQVSPEDVLPLFAHNVVTDGYRGFGRGERPTEYLVLLKRYVQQARELLALAGPQDTIQVQNCEAAEPLLKILGYRLARPCGPNTAVETAEPERAFLTIDSGFPLTDLEETLRGGKPFVYHYPAFQVPVILGPKDWTQLAKAKHAKDDILDCLLLDSSLARLYWAMSRIDARTQESLLHSPGLERLLPLAPVIDYYGTDLTIRLGHVEVPGGVSAGPAWKKLVGASPDSPGEFVLKLLTKDEGWLAAYFDTLSRISRTRQAYFTDPQRLQAFYQALRGRDIYPSPVRPVFRPNAGILLLTARLQFEPNGQPHIPGNLEVWKEIMRRKSDSRAIREWGRRANHWTSPEQLLEAMFALSRVYSEVSPVQVFLMLSDIDEGRTPQERLTPQTARLLANDYGRFGDQYRVFCEFHSLDNAAITDFLRTAEAVDRIPNRVLRADAIGLLQANIGFWQILARQGQIAPGASSNCWRRVVDPFNRIRTSAELYDAARTSLGEIMRVAGGKARLSQDEFIALLAGPNQASAEGRQIEQEIANKIRAGFDSQRLVSLDTLLTLGDRLVQTSQGKTAAAMLIPLAGELREFQLPKPLFTPSEKTEWTAGLANNPHLRLEMGTDLARILKSPRSPNDLAAARGLLVPFLRDTLVGLNYAFYAPPEAKLLNNNPLLVRSHDFSGEMSVGGGQAWKTPTIVARGWTAAGGAHLAGSMADLPYVLAEVEENFVVPENVQSLVWEDLVPTLLISSSLPRWWRVTGDELHAVTLYQRFGENLVQSAGQDEKLRSRVMDILENRLLPQRLEQVDAALRAGQPKEALSRLAPAETFYLGAEFRQRFPQEVGAWGKAGQELLALAKRNPQAVSWERLSEDFGVPHPALAQTYARDLFPVKPLPTYMGYSSRLLAESWDSNNLYWARLADEMGYSPVMLNVLAPELTRRMVGKIFATHLEDWPALLRALRQTGQEFREGKIASLPKSRTVPGI
ncbi:MAG: hypothetical protein LAP13_15645 [Acidobacteriia bacterium]|nr:hypothetical protein [Terriglobia bacterium]